MAYAVVYMNAQGRTIGDGSVVLWDTLRPGGKVHRYLTLRHFIVGLQRVREPRELTIASFEQEMAFLGVEAPEREEPAELDEGVEPEEDEQPMKRRRT